MNEFIRPACLATFLLSTFLVASGAEGQGGKKYTAVNVTNGGKIVGTVHFDGPRPALDPLDVTTKEDVCHTKPVYSEKLVVSDDQGVRWAVVSIEGISEGKPFPTHDPADDERPTLDQVGCVFKPHVAIVPRGKPLRIRNSDGVLHNVH
ncbi:MAG: cupredoxin domain-containing protein, partial [Planctomycetota bacterium]